MQIQKIILFFIYVHDDHKYFDNEKFIKKILNKYA